MSNTKHHSQEKKKSVKSLLERSVMAPIKSDNIPPQQLSEIVICFIFICFMSHSYNTSPRSNVVKIRLEFIGIDFSNEHSITQEIEDSDDLAFGEFTACDTGNTYDRITARGWIFFVLKIIFNILK